MEKDSAFYIGWQATAPPEFSKMVRRFVIGLCLIVPVSAFVMVYFQTGFSSGTFEYGKTTQLEGVFTRKPFPFLNIESGKDGSNKIIVQRILLVGTGKFGYKVDPDEIQDGARVKVAGFLIYDDGKTAFEVENITQLEERQIQSSIKKAEPSPRTKTSITLRGEITDPKCLLGVMNPGQGKPHLDCAVRCISGGVPPVLKVANATGETEYYLLLDTEGNPVNDQVLDYVGHGVQVCGQLQQLDNWFVLYIDPTLSKRINKGAINPGPMCN